MVILFFSQMALGEYLFVEGNSLANKNWTKFSDYPKLNLKNLFQQLAKSKTGKDLIFRANQKAKDRGLTLYDIVEKGHGSLTDTTLIRKFDKSDVTQINYEVNSKVYINKDLGQHDAILDLAHELTHFVFRTQFNPYVKNFSLSDFVKSTIEGQGGEVQAFMMECKVEQELFGAMKKSTRYNCEKIKDNTTGELSFNIAKKRFYQVGQYYESFTSLLEKYQLAKQFPDLSSDKESFISSAYGIPYPVAAFEEYISVLSKACENDKRRLALLKKEKGRSPASINDIENSYQVRCTKMFN